MVLLQGFESKMLREKPESVKGEVLKGRSVEMFLIGY